MQAGFPRSTVLNALTLSSVVAVVGIIGFSALSDRLGRRPVVLAGAAAMAIWAFLIFPMIDSRSTVLLALVVVVGQGIVHAAWYGPLAALYTELFSTRSRYTGASLGYQISGLGAGHRARGLRLRPGRGRWHDRGLDHHRRLLPGQHRLHPRPPGDLHHRPDGRPRDRRGRGARPLTRLGRLVPPAPGTTHPGRCSPSEGEHRPTSRT